MPDLNFDLESVTVAEFGVGRDLSGDQAFNAVSVNAEVKNVLRKNALVTWNKIQSMEDEPRKYDPSEKFASTEYLYIPLSEDIAALFSELHQAENLQLDNAALSDIGRVFCYFARFTDNTQRRLTALRRATQFKSLGKSRLISWITDALKLVEGPIFKLDSDFDLLVDSEFVHILRPSGFEFAGKLQKFVLDAVVKNIETIKKDIPFVNMGPVEEYATQHPRAARYLASIRAQSWARDIDKDELKRLCGVTSVGIADSNGQIDISDGHIMGFLEVLDRRRYEIGLVADTPEQFKAASRQKISL